MKTLKRLAFTVTVTVLLALGLRTLARRAGGSLVDRLMDRLPDSFPAKRMLAEIRVVRAQNERILTQTGEIRSQNDRILAILEGEGRPALRAS